MENKCNIEKPKMCNKIAEYCTHLGNRMYYYCKEHADAIKLYNPDVCMELMELPEPEAKLNEEILNITQAKANQIEYDNTLEGILDQRHKVYGDVRYNMNCQKELMDVINKYAYYDKLDNMTNRDLVGWQGCLEMLMHKVSRMVTGDPSHKDNYIDIAGYAKLMYDIVAPYKDQEK